MENAFCVTFASQSCFTGAKERKIPLLKLHCVISVEQEVPKITSGTRPTCSHKIFKIKKNNLKVRFFFFGKKR
jgi:hypothetical protein